MKTGKYYKMPQWAIQRLKAIAEAYEISNTEALLRCLDQGSKWHRKNIQREINPDFDFEERKPGVVLIDTTTNKEIGGEDVEKTIEEARKKWNL